MIENFFKPGAGALFLGLALLSAEAQTPPPPSAAVSGVPGVKQEAVPKTKTVDPSVPPPAMSSSAQGVKKIEGIVTIDGVKSPGQPPPPPPTAAGAVTQPGSVGSAGHIEAIHGVGGIDTAKLQNLETALLMKRDSGAPPDDGAEHSGKGKSAAAALLAAPLSKVPANKGPKEDGRAGFQEFEKLQNRGS